MHTNILYLLRTILQILYTITDTYLKLENLLANFDYPNIMDIKLGRVTYDPFASLEKIIREEGKFDAQTKIGFRISGMKVFLEFA